MKSSDGNKKSVRAGQPTVISASGTRQRFLRGMITHDLVQRGLPFDDSYAIAQQIRDRVRAEREVTTAEIRALILEALTERYDELPEALRSPRRPGIRRYVVYHGQRQPFSRGVLASSIHATGIDTDRAYRVVAMLEAGLAAEDLNEIRSSDLALRVGDALEELEGSEVAQRYRMMRRIQRLPRPLVIFVGGASGTGKSTLALELAPLLRIYRVNATDTIRQVMRMVFSPSILPALHRSSFELEPPSMSDFAEDRAPDPDSEEIQAATFEEQATRVCVGVRAVVERAIAENMSILVEGVHLVPPLIPFADLEGAAYQVPLMLSTFDIEVHRSRFLARSRVSGRRAERYIESFGAIRSIHDYLLQQSETHDVPLIDSSSAETPVAESLRLVSGVLEKKLPKSTRRSSRGAAPTVLLIIDGLADRPVRALGGRTPLQAAQTPTLDRLAAEGRCGYADPIAPGVVPDTAAGSLALFGQSPAAMKRGPVEALGAGFQLGEGDIALRGNLATTDARGQVIDRRAGRIREEASTLAAALDRLTLPGGAANQVEIRVRSGTEHRLAIVLRGDGLSSRIHGSDPGDGAAPGAALVPRPVDPSDDRAVETARLLALFEQEARAVLSEHPLNAVETGRPSANAILTRGAGRVHRLASLEESGIPLRLTCIAGDSTILGLASWIGARTVSSAGMTANLDTDLSAKFSAANKALDTSDLVVVHVKGADIAAHDQRPELKVSFLEAVDAALSELLQLREGKRTRIAVASDHATLSESGQHAADPLPVLIWGDGITRDATTVYDETGVAGGELGRFPLQLLLSRLFRLS